MIDDFESDPDRIRSSDGRGGWWFAYDDGTGGHFLRENALVRGGAGEGNALHAVASGFSKWGAGFGVNLHPATNPYRACAYDAAAYSGVRFRARGRGRWRVALGDAMSTPAAQGGACTRSGESCWDRPGVWVDLDDQWKTYAYPFCVFLPEGWGGSNQAVEPSKLFSFHFKVGPREQTELWLDDLSFYQAAKGAPAPRCGPPCPLEAVPRSARVEPAFSTAPLSDELSVHTFGQATHSCGGLTRRYLSYVPRGMRSRSSAPVLIMLHGSSGNAESARTFQTRNRFEALAARDRFVVVYGNAAPGPSTSPDPGFPNTGSWRHGLLEDGQVDDVDYLGRVLGDLAARGVIKGDNPVYLAGLSNGGGMVLEAARRIPHRIKGIAAMMPYDGLQPKPAADLSGTGLRRALFAYSIGDPGLPDGYHRILAPLPGAWAATMGVPAAVIAAPRKTSLPDLVVEGERYRGQNAVALATRGSRVTELDMATADGGARVRVLIMDHAGHFWPSSTPDTEEWVLDAWGFRNQDFEAADMVWEYLSQGRDGPARP